MYVYYFYQALKFYEDWITESQKIFKIVIKKIAIFSYNVSTEQRIFATKKKGTTEFKELKPVIYNYAFRAENIRVGYL